MRPRFLGAKTVKASTRQKRQDEKLAELLGLTLEQVKAHRRAQNADDKLREAEAVLLFVEQPTAFILKECEQCGGQFMTTYKYVSNCSMSCRIKSLHKIGIEYDPTKTPEERWRRTRIPTEYSIPPQALKVLLDMAKSQSSEPHAIPANIVQQNNDSPEAHEVELQLSEIDEFLAGLDS